MSFINPDDGTFPACEKKRRHAEIAAIARELERPLSEVAEL